MTQGALSWQEWSQCHGRCHRPKNDPNWHPGITGQMGVEGAQCVYSLGVCGGAALAVGAEVTESPPEERQATVARGLRLFSRLWGLCLFSRLWECIYLNNNHSATGSHVYYCTTAVNFTHKVDHFAVFGARNQSSALTSPQPGLSPSPREATTQNKIGWPQVKTHII